jgi:hypothetical protein
MIFHNRLRRTPMFVEERRIGAPDSLAGSAEMSDAPYLATTKASSSQKGSGWKFSLSSVLFAKEGALLRRRGGTNSASRRYVTALLIPKSLLGLSK